MSKEKFYPTEDNLGKDCEFWSPDPQNLRCIFPKVNMEGRTSCEGIIDDMCLYLKDGRRSPNISEDQIRELKLNPPSLGNKSYIGTS